MVKICLDPGHGGTDSGALLGKRYEKDDVLRLALAVKPLLEAQGVGVTASSSSKMYCALRTVGPFALLCTHRLMPWAAGPAASR